MVTLRCTEFTSFCPVTSQPDFGQLEISYIPDKFLAETKSVKLFLWAFRERRQFNEMLASELTELLWAMLEPHALKVTAAFNLRGGIGVTACVKKGTGL